MGLGNNMWMGLLLWRCIWFYVWNVLLLPFTLIFAFSLFFLFYFLYGKSDFLWFLINLRFPLKPLKYVLSVDTRSTQLNSEMSWVLKSSTLVVSVKIAKTKSSAIPLVLIVIKRIALIVILFNFFYTAKWCLYDC